MFLAALFRKMCWPFCDLPAGFHILGFKILNPWEMLTFSIFKDFESWSFLILRILKPQILKISKVFNAAGKSHFNPCFVYFQFQILWQPFPCVRNLLNKKHSVFLVCFCCTASHQSPISHITSSRRRANISSWARALNLEENLIPCEQVSWERNCCQGGLGFNQNEWALRKSWNSLLEQLRNICIQLDLPFL